MKKLLVIALSVAMILAFAAVSMAEATFSGEIDAGYKAYSPDTTIVSNGTDKDTSMGYIFGKIVMDGKLGDNVIGKMVIKSSDSDADFGGDAKTAADKNIGNFVFDEADVVFTEPFGSIKLGYFGWNNNIKDILDTLRGDVKSDFVVSTSIKLAENLTLGLAYAVPNTNANGDSDRAYAAKYGADLGYANDTFGADLMYTTDSSFYKDATTTADRSGVLGVQAYYKLGGFKPFIQYEAISGDAYYDYTVSGTTTTVKFDDSPSQIIVGFIYESADVPVYARVEYDAASYDIAKASDFSNQHAAGVRLGYKLASGAKLEAQYYGNVNGFAGYKDSKDYFKVICPF